MTTTATKSRGLLLRDHEVRELLTNGVATIVRPMKPQPHPGFLARGVISVVPQWPRQDGVRWFTRDGIRCPYGRVGDRWYGKEDWRLRGKHTDSCSDEEVAINTGHFEIWLERIAREINQSLFGRLRLAATMPRRASRLGGVMESIAVERIDGEWCWMLRPRVEGGA